MNKNKKLKEIDIKNCTCYYFDNIINIHDLDNVLIDLKSYKIISICKVTSKIPYGSKPLRIISDKADEYFRNNMIKCGKSRNLALFHSEKFDRIFHKIRYLMTLYSNILDVYSQD